jgi:hypothetical protein
MATNENAANAKPYAIPHEKGELVKPPGPLLGLGLFKRVNHLEHGG